ncbi:MAG: Uma2 family endonuclease [Planctomycetota bacterium]
MIVADPRLEAELIAERRANGLDRHDEVWEGTYVVMPLPNNEHQILAALLTALLVELVFKQGRGIVTGPTNLTDRESDWTENFRAPDLAVFLTDGSAENRDTHWLGGPDLVIEIVSPGDRSEQKLDFYASVGTREVLLVERDPWRLRLFRVSDGAMLAAGEASVDGADAVQTETVPIAWTLEAATEGERPKLVLTDTDGTRQEI